MKFAQAKYLKKTLVFLAVFTLFCISFTMGRMTAVRTARQQNLSELSDSAVTIMPLLRSEERTAAAESENIDAPPAAEQIKVLSAAPGEAVEEEVEEPPFPLLTPVDGKVSTPYSLQSVYSETMHDWRSHTGSDIEAPLSSAVMAAADGVVSRSYEDKLWGNVIELRHRGGLTTVYKGVSTLSMVKVGEEVTEGSVISGVGTAPAESKAMPHLHFEVWQDGVCVNPESLTVEMVEPEQ